MLEPELPAQSTAGSGAWGDTCLVVPATQPSPTRCCTGAAPCVVPRRRRPSWGKCRWDQKRPEMKDPISALSPPETPGISSSSQLQGNRPAMALDRPECPPAGHPLLRSSPAAHPPLLHSWAACDSQTFSNSGFSFCLCPSSPPLGLGPHVTFPVSLPSRHPS